MGSRDCFSAVMCSVLRGTPEMMSETIHADTITTVIRRGKNGYGFSVMGSSPATVRRVDPDSAAWLAGLQVDDAVIRINGQNVSRSIADSVAKIVRQSEKQIVLDIQRDSFDASYKCQATHPDSKMATRTPLLTISEDGNIIPEANKIVCKVDVERPPHSSSSSEDGSMDLSRDSSHYSSPDSSHDSSRDPLIDLGEWELPRLSKSSFPAIQINFDELSDQDQDRQSAIRTLLAGEENFVTQMQFGVQRYSNPLRHKLVSPAEHLTLFQNVEKLVSISEYHIYKLKEESMSYSDVKDSTQMFIDIVGCIYLPKIIMMSETYGQYCSGIKNSFRLLAELRDYEEFDQFLQDPPLDAGQPTICGFIQKPLEHIKNVVLNLQKILSLTALEHQDMDNLSQVIEALRNTCNRINESNTRRSRGMTSRSSRRSSPKSTSSRSSEHSAMYTVLSDSSNSSIESCIDTEVLDVQRRLVFCEHVQAFQLATATRHMIYCGDLMHVDGLLCTKLYAVLMSDLLLLTQKQANHKLLVVDYPILLHDIVKTVWMKTETMDFAFGVESQSNTLWVEPRHVTLRAPSLEQKQTWKNILQQRIASSKIQQERLMMNKHNFV